MQPPAMGGTEFDNSGFATIWLKLMQRILKTKGLLDSHKEKVCEMLPFIGATKHLYLWLCPSVGLSVCLSVGNAFVRQSTRRTLLAYLALLTGHSVTHFVRLLAPLTPLTRYAALRFATLALLACSVHRLAHSLCSLSHGTV